ncbi:tyrosine-type recombinase/integrase [Nocardioides agariphilus]|uniref:Tyrosine-type recombinase/integrase n=1 Tax=Nocardioides agariphilus TaxID=433664 RepID=A0A930VHX1_9ACTN|nr:tyrosine-type recombinase/integrase [Nocardioides agariphilus]
MGLELLGAGHEPPSSTWPNPVKQEPSRRAWQRVEPDALGRVDGSVPAIDRPTFRVHDLRHTCASLWLGAGVDPKVGHRILGHASAAMTMDPLRAPLRPQFWAATETVGCTTGAPQPVGAGECGSPRRGAGPLAWGLELSRLSESNRRPIHYE